jgi:hypothetical protein
MSEENLKFIPGLKLGELFYKEVIGPILKADFPELKYSAALIGEGSEILGYDTRQSIDHCWGPRTILFLSNEDYEKIGKKVLEVLKEKLAPEFMGYSTKMDCPVKDTINIFTIQSFFEKHLTIDPTKELETSDWLIFPSQKLLEITSGEVFHDDLGLSEVREKFSYYPNDIWLYILSCQWTKVSQEEAFVGRCGDVGDELGSQIVAARIVRELMKLCFLLEKKYVPYSKWFGTAFSELESAKKLSPILTKVLLAENWQEREKWLSEAYKIVAELHNSQKITEPLPTKVSSYYDRPYLVIHADKFAEATKEKIESEEVKSIKINIGSIDQFMDSTDVLSYPQIFKKLKIWSDD